MKTLFTNVLKSTITIASLAIVGCDNPVNFSQQPSNLSLSDDIAITPPNNRGKTISSSQTVADGNKDVDFLLVLDDSASMSPELAKLADRLSSFVASLESSNINWRMCLTTTQGYNRSSGDLTYGAPIVWEGNATSGSEGTVLKRGTPSVHSIFTSTIKGLVIGGGTSGDERGTKAIVDNFRSKTYHDCYRPNAAVSVILISDEDVRSVGGDAKRLKPIEDPNFGKALEADDLPETVVSEFHRFFGKEGILTVSSIIVKPGDASCEADQDKNGSPSHAGYVYEALSNLTEGGVGSICEADYSKDLNSFKDKIINSLQQITLECEPEVKSVKVKINKSEQKSFKVDGKYLRFPSKIIEGSLIDLDYTCKN